MNKETDLAHLPVLSDGSNLHGQVKLTGVFQVGVTESITQSRQTVVTVDALNDTYSNENLYSHFLISSARKYGIIRQCLVFTIPCTYIEFGKLSERRGRAHVDFPERVETLLPRTALNIDKRDFAYGCHFCSAGLTLSVALN